MFVKHIQSETGTRVQIKGQGSGFYEQDTGREGDDLMHISIRCVVPSTRLASSLFLPRIQCFVAPTDKTIFSFVLSFSSGPEESMIERAKLLADDLLLVVRSEWTKARDANAQGQAQQGYGGLGQGGYQQQQQQSAAAQAYYVRPHLFPFLFFRRVEPNAILTFLFYLLLPSALSPHRLRRY